MRSTFARWSAAITAAIVMMAINAGPSWAAPPANDDFASATVISGLPFSASISTVEATTAADDPGCIGQGPTVWYSFTPATDVSVAANTFGSDYDTTLSAYTGTAGSLTQIACNDDFGSLQSQVFFDAIAGTTYHLMVGSFASGPGGELVFSIDEGVPPPPPEIEITIDPVGKVNAKTGEVTLTGTVSCVEAQFLGVDGELTQRAGRSTIRGFFFDEPPCEGEVNWIATVSGDNGIFKAGNADASVFAFGCNEIECAFDQVSARIRLQGKRN